MKKRFIVIALASVMVLGLIACSNDTKAADPEASVSTEDTTVAAEPAEDASVLPTAGVYTFSFDEEMEGTVYTNTNYLVLNGDGTGVWVIQDKIDITYDEKTISSASSDSVPYEFKGTSLFIDEGFGPNEYALLSDVVPQDIEAWLNEQTAVTAESKRVEPIPVDVDPKAPADGEYNLWMDSYEDCQDSYGIKGTLYLVEKYDAEAVKALQPGDTVVVDGNDMEVATVDFSGSLILINGGEEEGGVCFRVYDDQPYCQVAGMDDFPTFVECGAINLFVPTDCVITDNSDIMEHPDGIVYTPAEFKKAMSDPTDYWYWNTSVVIKDGDIVEINIRFVP